MWLQRSLLKFASFCRLCLLQQSYYLHRLSALQKKSTIKDPPYGTISFLLKKSLNLLEKKRLLRIHISINISSNRYPICCNKANRNRLEAQCIRSISPLQWSERSINNRFRLAGN
uniref:Uncharacterized protein orf114b n=1 Tax=Chlorokybus atmophyticus TaxID=3144 RepID=A6YEB7_CHLAT|nr:hypothetical protein Chatpmp45 [Chlorokybus atmophyticus]ABO15147.1 hypothetical protein [Chlorokybus atmophyticus]